MDLPSRLAIMARTAEDEGDGCWSRPIADMAVAYLQRPNPGEWMVTLAPATIHPHAVYGCDDPRPLESPEEPWLVSSP